MTMIFLKLSGGGSINKNFGKSLIKDNYDFICQELKDTQKLNLNNLFMTIVNSEIVQVCIKDKKNVQTVFEKINSTGIPLTSADLIRNLLLTSNTFDEQKELYGYWVEIEKELQVENVVEFIGDYLILKTKYRSIDENKVYHMFKEYKRNSNKTNKELLEDLYDYAIIYKYIIRYGEFPDDLLNEQIIKRHLEEIFKMKSQDLYPLLLLVLKKMYNPNKKDNKKIEELQKIVKLLSDFIIRYRITGDYSGGGALQTAIRHILDKLINKKINFTHDSLKYELSNSPSKSREFPTNDRFREKLI